MCIVDRGSEFWKRNANGKIAKKEKNIIILFFKKKMREKSRESKFWNYNNVINRYTN